MMQTRGITLLLSVFVMGIALTVAVGIFNIFLGELSIGIEMSKSTVAFVAADSGGECALYWDRQANSFATSTGSGSNNITCGGSIFNVGGWESCEPSDCVSANDGKNGSSMFTFNFSNSSCAEVTVDKTYDATNRLTTTITSLGKNNCLAGAPRVVERGVELKFSRP